MQAQRRYNAACAAGLAGCGPCKDEPPLDDASRARWRKQALAWLEAELAAWSQALESGPSRCRRPIIGTLRHWKADPDLVGLREQGPLSGLREDERNACRALWAWVDAMLARASQSMSP